MSPPVPLSRTASRPSLSAQTNRPAWIVSALRNSDRLILAPPGAFAVKERRRDAIGQQRRGEVIEHRAEHELRLVVAAALEHRDAASGIAAPGRTRPCR